MGMDVFKSILMSLLESFASYNETQTEAIVTIVEECLSVSTVFQCENIVGSWFQVDVSKISLSVFLVAYWFLILKFVWKGFNIYILGVDGDEDADPVILVTNFIKAIAISLGFGALFPLFLNVGFDIYTRIQDALGMQNDLESALTTLIGQITESICLILMTVVYVVMLICLAVMFMKKSLELVILRIGISFAASGLLDSDQGVFKPYVKKFFQIIWTVIIQAVMFQLSVKALPNGNIIPAIMALSMAISAPAFLSEFIMANQGGGGKLQQAIYSLSILRSFAR